MALSIDPEDQFLEIDDAIKAAKRHHQFADDRIKRYVGNRHRDDWKPTESVPVYKPHEWEYVTNMVPNLVYRDPTVEVEGLVAGIDDEAEFAIGQVMPQWIHGVRFAERLQPLAYDTMFAFGVAMLRLDALPGYDGAPEPLPLWPLFERISWKRFFQDPRGGAQNWRFRGHYWRADQEDLLNAMEPDGSPTFDPDLVRGMAVDTDDKEFEHDESGPKGYTAQRKVVTGYEFYDRASGMIFTLGSMASGQKRHIRQPRQFVGFPDDPYVVFGLYLVPDQVYPLPPLAVTDERVRSINAHRHQMALDAATSKRLLAIDGTQGSEQEKVNGALSGSTIVLGGVSAKAYQVLEFGGASDKQREYVLQETAELNETSGMSDLRRGNITGKATATEVSEVAEADDARTEFARSNFHTCTTELLDKAARLMLRSDQVVMPIAVEMPDPMTGQMVKIPTMYVGGSLGAQDAASRIRLRITPMSMERMTRQSRQNRVQVMGAQVMAAAPLAAQLPIFPWADLFDDMGEAVNIKDAGERYFGWVKPLAMAQAQAAQQGQLPPGGESGKDKGEEKEPAQGAAPDPVAIGSGV